MHRSLLSMSCFLLAIGTAFGQTTSTDSRTLQELLLEVRQLREELRTSTVAAQRGQMLLYRLQVQQAAVARAEQRLGDAQSKLAEARASRRNVEGEIKVNEEAVHNTTDPAVRKDFLDTLPKLKETLEILKTAEQEAQVNEMDAEMNQRREVAKLEEIQGQLDRLEGTLEDLTSSQGRRSQ